MPSIQITVRVITSVMRSDHKAVVAYPQQPNSARVNVPTRVTYRKVTPNQHARFLRQVSEDEFINPQPTQHVQEDFDYFYKVALGLPSQVQSA